MVEVYHKAKHEKRKEKKSERTNQKEEKGAFAQHVLMMVGSLVESTIDRVRYKMKED